MKKEVRMSGEQTAAQYAILFGACLMLAITWTFSSRKNEYTIVMEMLDRIVFTLLYCFFIFVSVYNIYKKRPR